MTSENPEMIAKQFFEMGKKFYIGKSGNPSDLQMALDYFQQAALLGFGPAQRLLGVIYFDGSFVPQDFNQAFYWLSLAADQGDPQASYTLALMFAKGQGCIKDWSKAHGLLSRPGVSTLPEAMELKKRLKEQLIQLYPNLASAIQKNEQCLRMTLTSLQKRFIPAFLDYNSSDSSDQSGFETLLALNLGKITASDAYDQLSSCLNNYYRNMTNRHPAGPC
jgi:hypothetical protein